MPASTVKPSLNGEAVNRSLRRTKKAANPPQVRFVQRPMKLDRFRALVWVEVTHLNQTLDGEGLRRCDASPQPQLGVVVGWVIYAYGNGIILANPSGGRVRECV